MNWYIGTESLFQQTMTEMSIVMEKFDDNNFIHCPGNSKAAYMQTGLQRCAKETWWLVKYALIQ